MGPLLSKGRILGGKAHARDFTFYAVFAVLVLAAAGMRPAAALPNLPVETITIDTKSGPHSFSVEVAADEESRENAA